MSIDTSVKIGGEAGQGIQTVGELLALACRKAGLYILAINDFESRIRGGHNFMQIRICDRPVYAPNKQIHLLVSMDKKSYELHKDELVSNSIVIMDQQAGSGSENILSVPMIDLAVKAGGKITSNVVAAGACLSLLGAPIDLYKEVLSEHFGQKHADVAEKNQLAAELGYEAVKNVCFKWAFSWKKEKSKGVLLDGSKAFALGAIAADCRLAAFYPMSPATGIMAHLSNMSDMFPLVVEQAEDEIAAVNMIVGASFAGVRSMTATSGGGFCLMTEGLGLAAITEIPIVIINAQRPGPATGLPTRNGQGDLLFAIWASQDEFPRFVFAPATPADAFETTIRAFHLSEKYQVPAIIMSDQFLNDSIFLEDKSLKAPEYIERFIVKDENLTNPAAYKRYAVTETGVSPRVLPCAGKAIVISCGNEHREDGHTSEESSDRIKMVKKRHSKMPHMIKEMRAPTAYQAECDILLVGWGSTEGAIKEAVDQLRADKINAGCLHFTDIWPFPAETAVQAIKKAKRFYVVEGNATAQLGRLIREQTSFNYAGAILKYDGRPFFPNEIAEYVKHEVR